MSAPALDATAREAIRWMVLLQSGEASPQDRQGLDAWLRRDARHRAAWQHLNGPVADALDPARLLNQQAPGQAHAMADAMAEAKARVQRRRRVLRGALALGGVGTAGAALVQRFDPLQHRLADWHTATGQRRRFALADGGSVLLDARSAADVRFTTSRREVRLHAGALIADVPADPQRPFCVVTDHGEVQTLATGQRTRLLVRQHGHGCLVAALDQPLQVLPRHGPPPHRMSAGDAVWLGAEGLRPADEGAESAAAWEGGRIVAYDRPLGEVVDALRAYRTGFLRISPAAAALKVYASYPLDDTDAALESIAQTLAVSVHVHAGGWLVRIELA